MLRWILRALPTTATLVAVALLPMVDGGSAPTGVMGAAAPLHVVAATTPACASRPATAPRVADLPWAQQRYAPERLASLADGAGVTVAVIDSGVDARHPQLRGRVMAGADFLEAHGDGRTDCATHGTAVASVIAAGTDDGVLFRGLAPRARILPVRVSERQIVDGQETGQTVDPAQFAKAVRWAVDQGADVLNFSVVLYQDNPAVRSAIAHALDRNVVVVAAVGNRHDDGNPTPYPAAYPGVIGVGAIGPDGIRAQFSQVGPYVDVVAPGTEILAAVPGGGHRWHQGTSYAAPFVAATAALVRDYRPELSAAEVANRIIATADPAPDDTGSAGYGSGVVNPYRAVTDTGTVPSAGKAAAAGASRPAAADPATAQRRARAREMALWLATIGGGVAGAAALGGAVLRRGNRRRWRPGP